MKKSIGLLGLLTLALLGQVSVAGILDQKLSSIVSQESWSGQWPGAPANHAAAIQRDIELTPCRHWVSVNSKVSTFVSEEFYGRCLQGEDGGQPRISLFDPLDEGAALAGRGPRIYNQHLEDSIRSALAPHWLTVNMSKREIQLAKANPRDGLFQPLSDVNLDSISKGLNNRIRSLKYTSGIILVVDLLKAYQYELERDGHPSNKFLVKNLPKATLDRTIEYLKANLSEVDRGVLLQIPAYVAEWLEGSRPFFASDSEYQEACNLILDRFEKRNK